MAQKFYENEDFENLKLEYERIEDYEFYNCSFKNSTFEDCTLSHSSFIECRFYNCKIISTKVEFSQIKYIEFEKCNLIGVNWHDLLPAGHISNFKDCKLESTQFSKCDMRKADFREATGYQISITTNKMKDARFSYPEVVNLLGELGIKIN